MYGFPTGPVQEGLQQCSSTPALWKIPLQSQDAVQGNYYLRYISKPAIQDEMKAFTIMLYVILLNF